MTALLVSFWPYLVGLAGIVFGFVMRWWTKRQQAQVVAQAQTATEAQVRQDVAAEAQVAGTQAQADALNTRQSSETAASAVAAKGDDALNDALAAKGALRD